MTKIKLQWTKIKNFDQNLKDKYDCDHLATSSFSWIKVNIDCTAHGASGLVELQGIIRDHFSSCLGSFAASIGISYSLEVEWHAVIHAMDLAWANGWNFLWIECDSSLGFFLSSASHKIP